MVHSFLSLQLHLLTQLTKFFEILKTYTRSRDKDMALSPYFWQIDDIYPTDLESYDNQLQNLLIVSVAHWLFMLETGTVRLGVYKFSGWL